MWLMHDGGSRIFWPLLTFTIKDGYVKEYRFHGLQVLPTCLKYWIFICVATSNNYFMQQQTLILQRHFNVSWRPAKALDTMCEYLKRFAIADEMTLNTINQPTSGLYSISTYINFSWSYKDFILWDLTRNTSICFEYWWNPIFNEF